MPLYIKFMTGFTYTIEDAHSSFTVSDIKSKILNAHNIPISQQALIFGGRQLNADETLSSLGIDVGEPTGPCTIHCVLKIEDIPHDQRPQHYNRFQVNP